MTTFLNQNCKIKLLFSKYFQCGNCKQLFFYTSKGVYHSSTQILATSIGFLYSFIPQREYHCSTQILATSIGFLYSFIPQREYTIVVPRYQLLVLGFCILLYLKGSIPLQYLDISYQYWVSVSINYIISTYYLTNIR